MAEGKTVSIYEGKTHFSDLVALAEAGEETIVTRHGRPVARIAPLATAPRQRVFGLWKSLGIPDDILDEPLSAEEIALWEDGPVLPSDEDWAAYVDDPAEPHGQA